MLLAWGRLAARFKLRHYGQKDPKRELAKNLTPGFLSKTVYPWLFLSVNPISFV